MIEPNQTSVARLLRRKSSFEEYQRRLVDKIKRHFERRRRQWEKNFENQTKSSRTVEEEEEDEVTLNNENLDITVLDRSDMAKEDVVSQRTSPLPAPVQFHPAHRVQTGLTCTPPTERKPETKEIEILSIERTDFPDEGKTKHTILVNIQSFLPFGSVTVRLEEQGLILIGEDDSECHCRSRVRRGPSKSCEKLIELDGTIESDSMLVHTTREGVMRIEVVTSL